MNNKLKIFLNVAVCVAILIFSVGTLSVSYAESKSTIIAETEQYVVFGDEQFISELNRIKKELSDESALASEVADIKIESEFKEAVRKIVLNQPRQERDILLKDNCCIFITYSSPLENDSVRSEVCPFCDKGRYYRAHLEVDGPYHTGVQRYCIHHYTMGVDVKMYEVYTAVYKCTDCNASTEESWEKDFWVCYGSDY